jgi:hypothetical protein
VDDEDPEAIGMVLGEFVAEIFRTAFGRAEVIGDAIKEAFGGQDWTEIGKAVGAVAVDFLKGFAIGLFSKPEVMDDELEKQSRTLTAMFTENFVSTFLGALILTRLPIVGAPIRLLLRPFTIGFSLLGAKLLGLIPPILGSKLLGAFVLLFKGLKTTLFLLLTPFAAVIGGLFRTLFALLGGATTMNAMKFAEMIRTFFRTKWATLLRSGLGEAFALLRAFGIRAGIRAIGLILAGLIGAFLGWPGLIFAAAALAFREFIIRFSKWNEEKGDEYEGFGSKIVAFIVEGVKNFAFFQRVKDWFADRVQDLKNMMPDFSSDFEALGRSIVTGMLAGINLATGGLVGAAVDSVRKAFNAAKNWLDSRSPSRKFAELGDAMGEGMSKGLGDTHSLLAAAGVAASQQAFRGAEGALRAPEVPLVGTTDAQGQTVINVTVTSADPQAVVEALRRYTRANGPLGSVVTV